MAVYIGIDLGTSSVKVGAYTLEGFEVGFAQRDYEMLVDEPGMSELRPDSVVAAAFEALAACLYSTGSTATDVRGIGLSTQLYSLMALDQNKQPLTNLYTWADSRAESQTDKILSTMDYRAIFQRTAGRIEHPVCWNAKLCWLHEINPALFAAGNLFISIKCYLIYKLTGQLVMDWSDASATGIFNITTFDWDDMAVSAIPGLSMDHLPETRDCAGVIEGMHPNLAAKFGLQPDIKLVFFAGDGMSAHVGCGALEEGILSSTVGTSGALRALSRVPILDEKRRTFCFCLQRDFYVAGGAINNGGLVLTWLREQFGDQWAADEVRGGYKNFYELSQKMAGEVPPGSDGLVFLPFLTGERAPNWNGKATGILSGLTLHHDRRHILRAAMEGVMYQLNSVYLALQAVTGPAKAIHANGGYTLSDFWLQVQADIFGAPVAVSGIEQASAFGAAYIAMYAVGDIPSMRTRLDVMEPQRVIYPDEKTHALYRACAGHYYAEYAKNYGHRE